MQDKIIELFSTFLGKFEFFHKFVNILLAMDKKLTDAELIIDNLRKEIEAIRESYTELVEAHTNLESRISSISKDDVKEPANFSSAASVMQKQFDLYHQESTEE